MDGKQRSEGTTTMTIMADILVAEVGRAPLATLQVVAGGTPKPCAAANLAGTSGLQSWRLVGLLLREIKSLKSPIESGICSMLARLIRHYSAIIFLTL
jgi:hypothetical protein